MTLDTLYAASVLALLLTIVAVGALLMRRAEEIAADRDAVSDRLSLMSGILLPTDRRRVEKEPRRDPSRWMAMASGVSWFIMRPNAMAERQYRSSLMKAGFYSQGALRVFLAGKTLAMLLGVAGGFGIVAATNFRYAWMQAVCVLIGCAVGLRVADTYVAYRIATRQAAIRRGFGDFIDLMTVCLGAGNSVEQALGIIGNEIEAVHPVLAAELRLTLAGMRIDHAEAYDDLASRVPLPEFRSLATVLKDGEDGGASILDSLKIIAETSREQRRMDAEARAQRVPVLMILPLIGFMVPAMLLIVVGPSALNLIDVFSQMPGRH